MESSHSVSPENPSLPDAPTAERPARSSIRNRILFFLVAWAIVLMPFLFWRSTWFGRQLSDQELTSYLLDEQKPRHIQHALIQVGERLARQDASAARFYPYLIRLRNHRLEEIRSTDAWLMGQDNTQPEFRTALLEMLHDPAPEVRGNAALALVRFGDASGRPELRRMLQPATVTAPQAGRVLDLAKAATAIRQGGTVAKIESAGATLELRTPIGGRVRSLNVVKGSNVETGAQVALIEPAAEQVWEALRGLYWIGLPEDLPAVTPYLRASPELPDRIRQQASATEKAIEDRTHEDRTRNGHAQ
ncbi:MAG TPA: HEAT repeat domain-containing protein [Terriglobales bacterium]|nr:HEAT repeat domain-containing protein [Terriglobales bacterium]